MISKQFTRQFPRINADYEKGEITIVMGDFNVKVDKGTEERM